MEILGILTYLMLCVCAWIIASGKGRMGFFYFLLAIVLTPLIALPIAFIVSDKKVMNRLNVIINNTNEMKGDV